ncbi:hypothetical protein SV7mr_24980 [Stieleria bergensis]|uniref:Uncharacterized protein n=1 Tax=Stieleria bergensis TaxID=2528025 RepID=A0A517SV30_9BACT|nr:hypothetical protein SV7mr_24980 [Planctomycetes bacterium SV_7m_r]
MKSLNERYHAAGTNVHETFADLIFCALVVLVLFVMMLAIEVSQRVRTSLAEVPEVPEVATEIPEVHEIKLLSAEEIKELSLEVMQQEKELQQLRRQMAAQADKVANQAAALDGEQRFTGATEPAAILVAYDYDRDRFLFIRQKEFERATTKRSGESIFEFNRRSTKELVELALATREQRYFSRSEAAALYSAFSGYQQINPTNTSYTISEETLGVTYSLGLSAYIAGDTDISDRHVEEVEAAIHSCLRSRPSKAKDMYPSVTVSVNTRTRTVDMNGVKLSARNFKDLLLAVGGRGVMLDFEGYEGKAPDWLKRQVLEPAGYIGKMPKLP